MDDRSTSCPNCGRTVEAGFRFCDGCGTRLEAAPPPAIVEASTIPEPTVDQMPLIPAAAREPDAEKPSAGAQEQAEDASPAAVPEPRESVPFIERWRRRRAERSALGKAERALADPPPPPDTVAEVTAPAPVDRPARATSRPKTAEELRGARPAIGGRLQWSAAEVEAAEAAEEESRATAAWRPIAIPEEAAVPASEIGWGRFTLLFFAALLAGAIALLALTAIASVASDGRVALLEARGLPIFIGGAVSIIVFALLRTSERDRAGTTRRGTLLGVVVGLIGLIVLAAILYQPAVAGKLQPRIERALQVFGGEDEAAVEAFEQRVVEWNETAQAYHDELEVGLRNRENINRLRGSAVQAETTLEGITGEMRSSAEQAQHPELSDALGDLASIYVDQLGGLRLVNRGLLVDNIDLVRTGDARFKEAHERAGALYQARLQSLLARGGFDANSFGRAIAG